MGDAVQDLRYAFRTLVRSPGFALAAILTLGLGIGAATAVFSVVDAVLLRPLPVRDQDRVVVAWQEDRARGAAEFKIPFRYGEYEAVRERSHALAEVAALPRHGVSRWIAKDGAEAIVLGGVPVTRDFFNLLGVRPALGRMLGPADDVRGGPVAVVLSHGAWRRAFGGDPAAVGRSIRLAGRSATIVGVAPKAFDYPRGAELWVPALAWWNPDAPGGLDAGSPYIELDLVARLASGATAEQARAELGAIATELRDERGARSDAGFAVVVKPLAEVLVRQVRSALLLIAAGVALVLLIAGVNVANLLLARGIGRRGEFAVRAAVGARRRRIVRQLLTETFVLALAGGALGVLLAAWGIDALLALAPPELPLLENVAIGGRVLGFATLVSLLTTTLFGLLPALGATSAAPARALTGSERALGPVGGAGRVRNALVVGQIALTLVVLTGAGLLLKSLARLHALDPGYEVERLTLVEIAVPPWKYEAGAAQHRLFEGVLEGVRALPGVLAATAVVSAPFSGSGGVDIMFAAEGQEPHAVADNPWLNYEGVEPDYFRALGLPILRGRGFTAADRENAPRVVIVNQSVARQMWPGENAVGKRIKWGRADSEAPWITVVGVVADARYRTFQEVRPSVYVPFPQGIPVYPQNLLVRTRAGAEVVPSVRRVLAEIEPDLVVRSAAPMDQVLARPLAGARFQTLLLAVLAGLGLTLSTIGVYGLVAYVVTARTREIGLRMALGAERRDILGVVLRGAATIGGAGVALGLAGAAAGTRLLRGLLFQVEPLDPATFGAVALVLAAVVLIASWLPARRAARVDPMVALRAE